VRTLFNVCLFVILSATLVGTPVWGSPASPASVPLGVVLQAEYAQVGADTTAGGATVYDGDRLQTLGGGTLRAQLGGPQMYLRQNTIAQVQGLPNGFSAELATGTVVVSSTEGQTFELLADGATIRPAGAQATVAQITRVSATEVLLTSTRGALQVTLDEEVKTIEAGSSYRMEVEADESGPGPQPQGPYHTGRHRHFLMYLIVGGIATTTAILVWRALMSPCGL
jgi:hypothetical protein